MKNFYWIVLCVFFLNPCLHAIHWEVVGQDSKDPVAFGEETVDLKVSVGEHTIRILEENKLPFKGTAAGILSILNTPMGQEATVIENPKRMRVYGWCYTVDGKGPSVMADKFFFPSQKSRLKWFFAFSVYDNGNWIDCCTPAYLKPLPKG